MGDRYTITASRETLTERFARDISERYQPRYNAAPTQVLPVITQGSQGMSYFFWGQLPERSNNKPIGAKLLYVQSDALINTAGGRRMLESFRCLVPADGYYDWRQVSKKGRIPHRIVRQDNGIFAIAGIWEEFEDDEGHVVHTFKMITVPSSTNLKNISTTMPLILDRQHENLWLDPNASVEDLEGLIHPPADAEFRSYTVSPRIENPDNDQPNLIKPFSPADQFGNYSLFD
ncbi:SOS response-associated peptidase [Fulvivirga sedimenti]|uniref:Abasic site processing protein n=1 Tax=Fulvivirga sedimenti TaxID=2879465 RepID=A0A9X1KVC7_9BACT|nr:SOS response-associated peptidase [Fulvivirga sedimenti]MCA6073610.1 SOS response-associated peptidase [Fulvivirga sedimenti]